MFIIICISQRLQLLLHLTRQIVQALLLEWLDMLRVNQVVTDIAFFDFMPFTLVCAVMPL